MTAADPLAPMAATVTDDPAVVGLVEAFVRGKAPADAAGDECEDHVVIAAGFAAVVDGMSSPLRQPSEAPTGTRFARVIGQAISTLPPDSTAGDAIALLTDAVSAIRTDHRGPSGAVVAIVSIARREVWRVGDVHLRIGDRHLPGTKRVDEIGADYRALVNHASLLGGATVDEIRTTDPGLSSLRPLLESQEELANRPGEFGYGVIDGTHVPVERIEVFELPPETVEIALATDGFLSAASTLDAAEAELAEAIDADPACLGPELRGMGKAVAPGATHPDDRAYLRLRLQPIPPSRGAPS